MGVAENVNVYLGHTSVEPDPAYISLSSQKTVKIYNRSEYPVKFAWKAFANLFEETDERARLPARNGQGVGALLVDFFAFWGAFIGPPAPPHTPAPMHRSVVSVRCGGLLPAAFVSNRVTGSGCEQLY